MVHCRCDTAAHDLSKAGDVFRAVRSSCIWRLLWSWCLSFACVCLWMASPSLKSSGTVGAAKSNRQDRAGRPEFLSKWTLPRRVIAFVVALLFLVFLVTLLRLRTRSLCIGTGLAGTVWTPELSPREGYPSVTTIFTSPIIEVQLRAW